MKQFQRTMKLLIETMRRQCCSAIKLDSFLLRYLTESSFVISIPTYLLVKLLNDKLRASHIQAFADNNKNMWRSDYFVLHNLYFQLYFVIAKKQQNSLGDDHKKRS